MPNFPVSDRLTSSYVFGHCQNHDGGCMGTLSFRPKPGAVAAHLPFVVFYDRVCPVVSNNIVCSFGQLFNSTAFHEFSGFFQHSFRGQFESQLDLMKGCETYNIKSQKGLLKYAMLAPCILFFEAIEKIDGKQLYV
jgi:hypothetical protein